MVPGQNNPQFHSDSGIDFLEMSKKTNKGPDNPTSQLLPIIRTEVEAGRGREERQGRWWRIDKYKSCMWKSCVCEKCVRTLWCMSVKQLCVKEFFVRKLWNSCVWAWAWTSCVPELCVKELLVQKLCVRKPASQATRFRAGRDPVITRMRTDRPVPLCVPSKEH